MSVDICPETLLNGSRKGNPFREAAQVIADDGFCQDAWHRVYFEGGRDKGYAACDLTPQGLGQWDDEITAVTHCTVGALRVAAGERTAEPDWHERARLFSFAVACHGGIGATTYLDAIEEDDPDDDRDYVVDFDNDGWVTFDKVFRQFRPDADSNPVSQWSEQVGREVEEVVALLSLVADKLEGARGIALLLQTI